MAKLKHILLFSLVSLLSYQAWGTNYFVSNKGNDRNNGISKGTPWLSLQMINKNNQLFLFMRGDSIFLERGSIFREQLDISSPGIYLGAYGQGSNPIINGAVPIKDWSQYKKNIWKASCKTCLTPPENLFINNNSQSLGRYPNQGYLSITGSPQNQNSFSDNNTNFADGHWSNSEVVIRSSRWTLDNLTVTNYSHKTYSLARAASYPIQPGSGYFIQKHLSTLDEHGEWYFNPESKEIFLYLNSEVKPNTINIEVSSLAIGLNVLMADDFAAENLELRNQQVAGVRANTSDNIKFQCITILNAGKNGFEMIACANPRVESSFIIGSNNNGVEWLNNSGGTFTQNTIRNSGTRAGRGAKGNGTYIALNIASTSNSDENSIFQYNTIDSTGYIGIDFRAGNIQIKNNRITNFCLMKDDGAAIYTWGNTKGNNTIEDNTIDSGLGTGEGSPNPNQLFASGIYIDDRSSHVVIKGNTVSHCSTAGIFLHNARYITVADNILIGNGTSVSNKEKGQLYIKLDTLGEFKGEMALHLDVSYNLFIVERDAAYCLYLSAEKEQDLLELGIFNLNQYRANHTYQAVGKSSNQLGSCSAPEEFTLAEWQEGLKYDVGSTFKKLASEESITITSRNLINNSNMTANTDGWMAWPQMSAMAHEKDKIIDGPCLKINVAKDEGETLVYHSGFALDKTKLYRLTFSAMSTNLTRIEFAPLMANTPWQSLGDHTCFAVDSTYRTFTYFFRPDSDCQEARVNFKGNQTFWIDNVCLNEILEPIASR